MNRPILQLTLAALASLSAAGETTTFELPPVSGVPTLLPVWSGFSPVVQQYGEARVQDTLAGTGSQALEMSPGSAVAWAPGDLTAPPASALVSSFQLRLDTLSSDVPVIPAETLSAVVFANVSGLMALDGNGVGGGTWQTLQILAADTFYNVTITRDYGSQTYDVEVDGSLVAEGLGFKDPVTEGPFTAIFESSERAWLDDVSAEFVAPPAVTPISVANFSFENPDITNNNVTGVPTDWTAPNGTTGIKYRDNYAGLVSAGIPDGNQWALITYTASNKGVTLAQNTGVTIVEGVTYTLTVAVGEQDNFASMVDIARIFLYGSTTGDGAPFALLDNIDPITTGAGSAWGDYQVSFTATASQAGESLVIGLGAGSNIGNGAGFNSNVNFDNVRLHSDAIPVGDSSIVYESFDHTAGTAIVGKNGGTGFGVAWTSEGTTTTNTNNLVGTGLSFGSLPVAGGSNLRSIRDGVGAISRTISSAAQTALTADNSTIWFSALMAPSGGNGFALNTYGTLIFGDTSFATASSNSAPPLPGGNAFGVGFVGEEVATTDKFNYSLIGIQGVAYSGGSLTTDADATVADVGDVTSFIVGRIDFAPIGSNDTLRLYRVTDPGLSLPASPFATLSVDLDQSGFNVVSIGDAQTSIFDEIRIGTSLADVVGGNDYDMWAISYPGLGLPGEDDDGDGLSNDEERLFGLNPQSGTSVNPFSVPLDAVAGTFSYTRRAQLRSKATYTVWYSTNLHDWFEDPGASQDADTPVADVETVAVHLSAEPLGNPKLFVRIKAEP